MRALSPRTGRVGEWTSGPERDGPGGAATRRGRGNGEWGMTNDEWGRSGGGGRGGGSVAQPPPNPPILGGWGVARWEGSRKTTVLLAAVPPRIGGAGGRHPIRHSVFVIRHSPRPHRLLAQLARIVPVWQELSRYYDQCGSGCSRVGMRKMPIGRGKKGLPDRRQTVREQKEGGWSVTRRQYSSTVRTDCQGVNPGQYLPPSRASAMVAMLSRDVARPS